MPRGFESHRLRQEQHLAGCCLLFLRQNFARAARWDSNSPCPALCVPPGCNSPADCCKGAGESHRLRQEQHPAGCCFLFLRQTMQGLQGGIRTARARRFASRRAKMPRWGIFRARENPTVCAKYHYSILTLGSDFLLSLCKIPVLFL